MLAFMQEKDWQLCGSVTSINQEAQEALEGVECMDSFVQRCINGGLALYEIDITS